MPKEVAVEVTADGESYHFCSVRCAGARLAPPVSADQSTPSTLPARRILVAVDGSGPSHRAVEWAAALAAVTLGQVLLLIAIDLNWMQAVGEAPLGVGPLGVGFRMADMERVLREDAEAQLEPCEAICKRLGVTVSSSIELARPVEAILKAAHDVDLVVMGSRGRGAISGAVLGSVSQRVIGGTRTPVLIVH